MRQIKFRGKRVDNSQWAYGWLTKHINGNMVIMQEDGNHFEKFEVMPQTVGQYTGVKASGVELYEGDITDKFRVINYRTGSFWVDGIHITSQFPLAFLQSDECDFSIIGNKLDNPELFKK